METANFPTWAAVFVALTRTEGRRGPACGTRQDPISRRGDEAGSVCPPPPPRLAGAFGFSFAACGFCGFCLPHPKAGATLSGIKQEVLLSEVPLTWKSSHRLLLGKCRSFLFSPVIPSYTLHCLQPSQAPPTNPTPARNQPQTQPQTLNQS